MGQGVQPETRPEEASRYLRCARIDLRASRSLDRAGVYAPAVFHLQQSVEKATTSLILWLGLVSSTKAGKLVAHDTSLAFVELVRLDGIAPLVDTMAGFFSLELQGDARQMEREVKKRAPDMARLRHETIVAATTLFEDVETEMRSGGGIGYGGLQDGSVDAELAGYALELGMIAGRLLVLGLVTYAHATSTRYPDHAVKPWRYTTRLGVVKALPVLHPMLASCLRNQQEFLAMTEAPRGGRRS